MKPLRSNAPSASPRSNQLPRNLVVAPAATKGKERRKDMPKQELIDEINSKDIPEDVRAKALAAIERIAESGEAQYDDEGYGLDGHFVWDATQENHVFWSEINKAPRRSPDAATSPRPQTATRKQRILDRLTSVEQQQADAEAMRWQKRDDELAAITVDKSKPFIGAADVQWMLKGKAIK